MLDKLLQFYSNNLDIVSISVKHYIWWWRVFWVFFAITTVEFLMYMNKGANINYLLICTILATFLFLLNLNRHRKFCLKLIEDKFCIRIKNFKTSFNVVFDIKISQLVLFLEQEHLGNCEKVKIIIEMINKEINNRKLPKFFIPGLFLALFIPIWAQLVRILYDFNKNPDFTIKLTLFLVIVVILVTIVSGFFKTNYEEIKYSILDNKIEKLKDLEKLLQEVLLRLKN